MEKERSNFYAHLNTCVKCKNSTLKELCENGKKLKEAYDDAIDAAMERDYWERGDKAFFGD